MKRCLILSTVVVTLITPGVYADAFFDFNSLSNGSGSSGISSYMTGVYGSPVTVTDAKSHVGGWSGNSTPHIWTALQIGQGQGLANGDFEISFAQPITGFSFDGYVFEATSGADFVVRAYNGDYDETTYLWNVIPVPHNREYPWSGAEVYSRSWSGLNDNSQISQDWVTFSEPVSLLVFSDHGQFDVGIDNLRVSPLVDVTAVPVPSALLLGAIGLAGAVYLKHRLAIV